MKPLHQEYIDELAIIKKGIQDSDILAKYLDEEEEEDYLALRAAFEPAIAELYKKVANDNPLQLLTLEKELLDEAYEGMYITRILGFSVLRGEINDNYKYVRPQSHFKDVLVAIVASSNYDIMKKRIGQTIQIGFALSSDIWITNLINEIVNKRIRYFFQSQKNRKYRELKERKIALAKYKNQFRNENYFYTEFPTNSVELKVLFSEVKLFLKNRIILNIDNSSFIPEIKTFLNNPDFQGTEEYMEMLAYYGFFFDKNEADQAEFATHFNRSRTDIEDFENKWLDLVLEIHSNKEINLDKAADLRLSAAVDKSINDKISRFYTLTDEIHSKSYTNDEVIEAIKIFYNSNPGKSKINECVRATIYKYFARFITNLAPEDYNEFFELAKIFPTYMGIFDNQQFNQNLKELCVRYVKKLTKKFVDKRGRAYQDVKRFVKVSFVDFGFMTPKQIVEFFKTKRVRKPKES
ncbi:MAG TPA: hypothetical protein ENJ53_05860 [Phaeodactylibacter sp.]|nr:hypothetical protein [Phaeodactylibacter sp.]